MEPFLIIFAQFLFSASDFWKKLILRSHPMDWRLAVNPEFLAALILPLVPLLIYLYVLSRYDLSRSAATLGVSAVVFSAFFGIVALGERVSSINLVGFALAALAVVLIYWR